jgi:uncharacterized protein (DUF433 family)
MARFGWRARVQPALPLDDSQEQCLESVGRLVLDNNYVSVNGDSYRITGSRVSLDSVVCDYLSGLSPESIADNFDTLSLEQVYGAITFYLSHRDEVDRHLMENRAKFDALRKKARESHPLLYRKLEEMQEAVS